MAEGTELEKLTEIERILRKGLLGESREFEYSRQLVKASEPVTIQPETTTNISPGETRAVVNVEVPDHQVLLLSGIGTNDIPQATYQVLTDGDPWGATPAPIGTVAKPFNALEELGGYVTVRDEAAYLVRRNTDAGSSEDWSGILTGRIIRVI